MFDASILTALRDLAPGGTFVIKSSGGDIYVAMRVANLLRERQARVVTYDLCLSACANAIFVATDRTIVAEHTIIAWHGSVPVLDFCPTFAQTRPFDRDDDATVRRNLARYCENRALLREFYVQRGLDAAFTESPQTPQTRTARLAILPPKNPRGVFWMWHPANHGNAFKDRVVYLGYPAGQAEVDAIAARDTDTDSLRCPRNRDRAAGLSRGRVRASRVPPRLSVAQFSPQRTPARENDQAEAGRDPIQPKTRRRPDGPATHRLLARDAASCPPKRRNPRRLPAGGS